MQLATGLECIGFVLMAIIGFAETSAGGSDRMSAYGRMAYRLALLCLAAAFAVQINEMRLGHWTARDWWMSLYSCYWMAVFLIYGQFVLKYGFLHGLAIGVLGLFGVIQVPLMWHDGYQIMDLDWAHWLNGFGAVFVLMWIVGSAVEWGERLGSRYVTKRLIPRLCRQSGWVLTGQEGTRSWLRPAEGEVPGNIWMGNGGTSVRFYGSLHAGFSLRDTPAELLARLLVRSESLCFAGWRLTVWDDGTEQLNLYAQLPIAGLTVPIFDLVCREIRDELVGLDEELRTRFHAGGDVMSDAPAAEAGAMPELQPVSSPKEADHG